MRRDKRPGADWLVIARFVAASLAMATLASPAGAQDMPGMPGMSAAPAAPNTPAPASTPTSPTAPPATGREAMNMPGMNMGAMPMMAGQLGPYSMMRDASGTAWQPDSTPMEGISWRSGGWSGMIHGRVSLIQDQQTGPRGGDKTFSESMFMVMAQHAVGPGTLTLRSMLSLEPLMGPAGYPLLLQTGETADGVHPLIDRQHPHDLFMEMAGVYSVPLGRRSSVFIYVGYPGEPALGPPTFMHRFSGEDDPAAPITHHWLDSTHITFGVVTAGFTHGPLKIEASAFKGREPDQHRWDFDPFRLDSYSGRISLDPGPDWALQVSYGYIHSPEQLTPGVDQDRLTASVSYNRPLRSGNWQTTIAFGRNYDHPGKTLDALLIESAVSIGRHTIFGRAENVQKDELFASPSPLADRVFRVSELTLGYVYDLPLARHLALGVGVEGTLDMAPSAISLAYGDHPGGYMPFIRLKVR
ncbi:MAG TPA: hypothetical protein VGS12_07500 [Caulobacteraceae bacterium]|nr:hypothetical protein [Caulobacteraceae bacterium]